MNRVIIGAVALLFFGGGILLLGQLDQEGDWSDVIGDESRVENEEEVEGVERGEEEYLSSVDNNVATDAQEDPFIRCLAEKDVVIYGSRTCPACARLVEEYKNYENLDMIYVECTEEGERCNEEMLVGYVPAIQIKGELFDEWGSPENLSKKTGCEL